MTSILSLDIDLCRIHAYSNEQKIVCYNSAVIPYYEIDLHEKILIEVYSANFYRGDAASIYNTAKAALFNSMTAGQIFEFCRLQGTENKILVSPSSAWTLGYSEKTRQSIAGVAGDNHDIREARTMQFFYATNPEKWIPFMEYFNGLSTKKKKVSK